jgi:hypothetical protein
MKEIVERLDAIDSKLSRVLFFIGDLGQSNVQNFTTLDKLIKEKIDAAKQEIITSVVDEIRKGK